MSKPKITYVGHASFLIEMKGKFILTDPNFSKKVLFIPRLKEPGIKPENLPPLTAIAVTHAHYDHLDLFSFKYFSLRTPLIVPKGLGGFMEKFLRNPIIEIPPWSEHTLENIQIYSVPVKHRGFRLSGLTLRATTGYLFKQEEETVFFPGDTAYGEHFRAIANLYKVKTALLPIGAYEPRWIMRNRHMNPEEALKAFEDLKAETLIPYHWGTFRLSSEKPEAPIEWLKNLLKEKPNDKVKILEPGETFQ